MRIHYLQHVPFEGLGCINEWAMDQGHTLSATALFNAEPLPEPSAFDMLIVMGGPMGVQDTSQFPWLDEEKQFISQYIDMGKKLWASAWARN